MLNNSNKNSKSVNSHKSNLIRPIEDYSISELEEILIKRKKEAGLSIENSSYKSESGIKHIDNPNFDYSKGNLEIVGNIENIHKSFNHKKVLKGVSFNIYKGETLALVGANGAGKTVLMEILAGLIEPDEGKIKLRFDGLHPEKELGMQFQDSDITGGLKPKHLIELYRDSYKHKNITDQQINEMIDVFGIKDLINRKVSKFSGGQRQRVNLFLALLSNPKLVILDEFITGLDITSVINILEYVKKQQIKNNSTLIIISHQPEEIKMLADRILVLKEGQIVNETTVKSVLKKYSTMTDFMVGVI